MKRHVALQPFSRDHNVCLTVARSLATVADGDVESRTLLADKVNALWHEELKDHFAEEEQLLSGLASAESAKRLRDEHAQIEAALLAVAASSEPEDLRTLGGLLDRHIRWEERSLFVEIENRASPEQLAALERATQVIEDKRANSRWSPRRGELMKRRSHSSPEGHTS